MIKEESGNSKEIEQALETLSQMRTLIRGNLQIIRPLFHDQRFGLLGFWVGIASALICLALSSSKLIWPNYKDIPPIIQMIFAAFCIVVLLAGMIGKIVILDRAAKKKDENLSLLSVFQYEEISRIMTDAVISLIVTITVCIIAGKESGNWWVFVPGMYVYFGFILLQTGSLFFVNAYRIQGIISFGIAVFLLLFMKDHYEIWLSGSIALFFTGFGADIIIRNKYFSSTGKADL
ncbi:MAG TPA: hypothetical protein PLG87_04220 [Treponemataceae bacterium]|jgi:hypothetical protein|nr:hypothetical protein [Treponemataceae bacterium]